MNEKYRRMAKASHILAYIPWISAAFTFAITKSLLVSLALLTLLGFTMSLLAIILGHVARYKIRKNDGLFANSGLSISGLTLGYLGFAAAFAFFLWLPNEDALHGKAANESSAVGSLRSIYLAADSYKAAHPMNGFPEALVELSSYSNDSTGAKIDSQIIGGQKSGYRFTYVPKHGKNGRTENYEVFADPIKEGMTGTRHFFVDQSGVLRFAIKTQANAESAAIW